jgi:hypothetical protein
MSNRLGGQAIALGTLGTRVTRAAALQPQTGQAAIFTVAGGKVLVTGLIGEVVVATPSTTNTLKITGNPTSGTDVDWTSATSTASLEAGSMIHLGLTAGGALIVKAAGGGGTIDAYNGRVAQVGTIDLVTSGSAATGTIKWTLFYVPIDDNAVVTAA